MLRYVGFVVAVVLLAAGWFAVGPWILVVLLVALLVPAARRRMRPNRWLLGGLAAVLVAATAVVVLLPDGRLPIPPGGGLLVTSSYDGDAVEAQPIELSVPQHPGLAANGSSTMHDDAWATDSYQGPGPLGKDPEVTTSWYGLKECATLAFDPEGRLVGLCGDRTGPVLHVLDPETMRPLRDPGPAGPRGLGQAAVGGPLRRRLLLSRRAGPRGRRDDRPPPSSPSTATGWRCSTRST